MKNKILYSSKEIKSAIKNLFNTRQRRVAITAFVGDEANAYLPHPEGIELYCWAKAGGTNPKTIRELIKKYGVKVYFSDFLHMKIYWSNKGSVITSANLSTYALGSGGLKEVGVLLPSNSIDINKIINSIKPYKATEKEIDKLEKDSKLIIRTNNILSNKSNKDTSFKEWFYINQNRKKPNWRTAFHSSSNVKLTPESKKHLIKEHSSHSYNDILETNSDDYVQDDWLLCYEFNGKQPINIEWMYAHHTVRGSQIVKGKKKYLYQIIQVNKLKAYDKPPFKIDPLFKKAFRLAHSKFYGENEDKMEQDIVPPKDFLRLMYKNS